MLSKRDNLLETIHGGDPDRYVKQFECLSMVFHPLAHRGRLEQGGPAAQDQFGVWHQWYEGQPGSFPVHTPEKTVIKDIDDWKRYLKMPRLEYPESAWEPFIEQAEKIDRTETFCTAMVVPGIFEWTHMLAGMEDALCGFHESPDEMHDIIAFLTEYEMAVAEGVCSHYHPDALYHHDDWGTQISTFMRPEMFDEFLLEPYRQIYGYYKDHGVEIVVHHSDSFCATIVPEMIEMGVDIWQGPVLTNNIPELIGRYGEQITFMGGLENNRIDRATTTVEEIRTEVREVCEACGSRFFIPCMCRGGAGSINPGIYEMVDECIDIMSGEMFSQPLSR